MCGGHYAGKDIITRGRNARLGWDGMGVVAIGMGGPGKLSIPQGGRGGGMVRGWVAMIREYTQ